MRRSDKSPPDQTDLDVRWLQREPNVPQTWTTAQPYEAILELEEASFCGPCEGHGCAKNWRAPRGASAGGFVNARSGVAPDGL